MKNLKDILYKNLLIKEKLIINKNIKIKNVFVDTILRFIYAEPEDAEDDEVNVITHWVKEENVEHLIILSTLEILEKYGLIDPDNEYLEKDLRKDFENDNIEIILDKTEFIKFIKDNGDEIYKDELYKDKYNRTGLYSNNELNLLTYDIKTTGIIFFIKK